LPVIDPELLGMQDEPQRRRRWAWRRHGRSLQQRSGNAAL